MQNEALVERSIERMRFPPYLTTKGEVESNHPFILAQEYDDKGKKMLYRCTLCEVRSLSLGDLRQHCHGHAHYRKQYYLRKDVERASLVARRASYILANPLYDKIQALPEQIPAAAIDAVHAELYRYLIAPAASHSWCEFDSLDRPLKKMKACFQTEALVLLALAVWKAQCLKQMPPSDTDAQDWIQSGWKSCKAQQPYSNAMEIIVTNVRPFLDWSQWNHI
jgi:hypothetical protein